MDFTLTNGSISTLNALHSGGSVSSPQTHVFVTPTGSEFAGFFFQDSTNYCETSHLAVYYNPIDCSLATAIQISVNSIDGQNKKLFILSDTTLSFTAIDTFGTCGPIEYQISYTPDSSTSGLIYQTSNTQKTVTFKQTSNIADA